MPAGPSQQDAKRAGSLTFEMEIVDPLPVLAKLQDIRQESDASLVNLVDTCAQCFQRMRDLQVELQSKLILTNTPPEIWREQWDAAQQEMLNLHQLLFHPENSYQASLTTLNQLRKQTLQKHDSHWDFMIREFTRWAECLLKLSHRFYIVEDEINSRSKELLEAFERVRKQLEYTTKTLDNARKGVDLLTQAQWTEDDNLIAKYAASCVYIQRLIRGYQTRKLYLKMKKSIPFMRYHVKRFLKWFRRELLLRNRCVPHLIRVQAHCRRHLAKKLVNQRMDEVCGPIAERLCPLMQRFYFDSVWMDGTVLAGWAESALTMQRLFRGFKGRKRYRRQVEKKRKEQMENARKQAMAAADREAEELKKRLREEEKARKKAEAEFAAAQAKRAEARAQAEKEERERLALEEHLKKERRMKEAAERKKQEALAKQAKKDEIERKREAIRKQIAKERKIQQERENNRKQWAREALAEQRRLWREKLVAEREAREAEAVQAEVRRGELLEEKKRRLDWFNRPWEGDDEEVKKFQAWLLARWGELPTVAEPSLQLVQHRIKSAYAFLDKQVVDVLPTPGFTARIFTEMLTIKLRYSLEARASAVYAVLDRSTGGSGLLPADVVVGEPRPSPRMLMSPGGRTKNNIEDLLFRRTTALNQALIALAQKAPLVLLPGDAVPAENPPAVCFRPGADQPDVFFSTTVWTIANFARFISEKKEDYESSSATSTAVGGRGKSGKRLSPFLENPNEHAVAGVLLRKDRKEIRERRRKEKQRRSGVAGATPGAEAGETAAAADPAAAPLPPESPNAEILGAVTRAGVDDSDATSNDASPRPKGSGSPGENSSDGGNSPGAGNSPPLGGTSSPPQKTYRSPRPIPEDDELSLSSDENDDMNGASDEDRRQQVSDGKQREITMRCQAFEVDDIMMEIEMRVSNPRTTRKRHLSMYLRAKRGVHVRVVFYVGDTIGLPRDLKFERSADALGERKFLTDYNEEYGHRLEGGELDALASEPGNLPTADGVVEAAAGFAASASMAVGAGGSSSAGAGTDLSVGFVLLQDLKERPDQVLVFGHPQDRTRQVVKWMPQLKLEFLQQYYPRGWSFTSPKFKINKDGPFWLEFWPNGSFNTSKTGTCSICLHAPRLKNAVCGVQFWACELDCFVEGGAAVGDHVEGAAGGSPTKTAGSGSRKKVLTKEKEHRFDHVVNAPAGGGEQLGSTTAGSSSRVAYRPQERTAMASARGPGAPGGQTANAASDNKCMVDEFCNSLDVAMEPDAYGGRSVVLGCIFKRTFGENQKDKVKQLASGLDLSAIAFNNF